MQECETGTGKNTFVKRVSVRSGGAGHAHSGVIKGRGAPATRVKPVKRRESGARKA